MKKYFIDFTLSVLLLCNVAIAEVAPFREEMQSDRPDFTEGAFVVDKYHFQVESGYTYSRTSDGADSHIAPEMLLRIGAFDSTEIRIFWEGYQLEKGADGPTGYSLGFKNKILEEGDLIPRTSLIGEVGPVNLNHDYSQFESGFKILLEKEIFGYDLASNLNLFRRDDAQEIYIEGAASLSLGFELTEELRIYLEPYAVLPFDSSSAKDEYYFNGGFTVLVHENLQIDIRSGVGLNNNADDMFMGSGFVYRR